jgi:hypothetical protein
MGLGSMVVDYNSLLQTNATIIAGLLILLTIYSLKIKPSENTKERIVNVIVGTVTIIGIVPFSISAMMILRQSWIKYAATTTYFGFLYLIVGIVLIVVIPWTGVGVKKVQKG